MGQLEAIGIEIAANKTATEAVGPAWALVEQFAVVQQDKARP